MKVLFVYYGYENLGVGILSAVLQQHPRDQLAAVVQAGQSRDGTGMEERQGSVDGVDGGNEPGHGVALARRTAEASGRAQGMEFIPSRVLS